MRQRDTRKEELVKKQAIKLIVEEGLKGFTMQKLARRCNISVATLYIYYQDKNDLICKLGEETAQQFTNEALKNFSPEMSFAAGLRIQWINRVHYALNHRMSMQFYEILRHSPYADTVLVASTEAFRKEMQKFVKKAIAEKQLRPLPLEVYWSLAFGPLYALIRFHFEKKSVGNRSFRISDEHIDQTLPLVLAALKP